MFTDRDQIPVSVRRMAAARHEAGHILVAIHFGDPVRRAVLNPPDGLSGEMQFEESPDEMLDLGNREHLEKVERRIVTLWAGNVAELEFWRGLASIYNPRIDTHRHDWEEIKRYAVIYNAKRRQENLDNCKQWAARILSGTGGFASQLEIAKWLAENREIDRAKIDEILAKHGFVYTPGSGSGPTTGGTEHQTPARSTRT